MFFPSLDAILNSGRSVTVLLIVLTRTSFCFQKISSKSREVELKICGLLPCPLLFKANLPILYIVWQCIQLHSENNLEGLCKRTDKIFPCIESMWVVTRKDSFGNMNTVLKASISNIQINNALDRRSSALKCSLDLNSFTSEVKEKL